VPALLPLLLLLLLLVSHQVTTRVGGGNHTGVVHVNRTIPCDHIGGACYTSLRVIRGGKRREEVQI